MCLVASRGAARGAQIIIEIDLIKKGSELGFASFLYRTEVFNHPLGLLNDYSHS
jgi:hypothetical protein